MWRRNINIKLRVAVILMKEGKILLVKHSRDGKSYWVLPGGRVEYGETLRETARRELAEEVRIQVEVGDLVFVDEVINPDGSCHIIDLYFRGRIVGDEEPEVADENVKEARFFAISSLKDLVFYPPILDELLLALEGKLPHRYLGNRFDKAKKLS